MTADQRSNAANWERLAGLTCTCRPDCTDTRWGNGPTPCATDCQPCRIMAGVTYQKPPRGGKKAPT